MLSLLAKVSVLFPCSSICIWWVYSMGQSVRGGTYSFHQALSLASQMGGLTTLLVAVVWLLSPLLHKRQGWMQLAIKTTVETAVLLSLYTVAVFAWRQHWTPEMGMTDSAAFMPVLGHVNAAFFSEFLWLEYLVVVVPAVAVLSGFFASSFDFLKKNRQLKQRQIPSRL